jgi:hypothetical protein
MPKVEFTLSFEDYLDYYGRGIPRRKTKIAGSVAVTGIAIALVGFLSAIESSDSVLPNGALAISGGICMALMSIPLWFVVERRSPEKIKSEHRRSYESLFSAPRVLEFNTEGWSYSYGAAKNSLPWSDLTSVADLGRVLVLADRYVQYLLPVSAFSNETLKDLTEHCERALNWQPSEFTVPIRVNALAYIRARVAYRWRRATAQMVSLYFLGLVMASIIAAIFAAPISLTAWPIAAVLILFMPLSEILVDAAKIRPYRANYSFDSAAISSSSICFRDSKRLWNLPIKWLASWQETSGEFRLYVTDDQFYIFSKKRLSQKQSLQLRESLVSQTLT